MRKEFASGFLGWFILGNIALLAIVAIFSATSSTHGLYFILFGIWAPTVIALIVLFTRRRIANGIGILTAIAVNLIMGGPLGLMGPIPSAYIVYILLIMDVASPPYSNLINLLKW